MAFLGRSNVGKSSLLNCLLQKKGLAFTSSKPGCTQLINFYRVGLDLCFVDLPGYGYAKVPKEMTVEWKRLIESYLVGRPALQTCILLLDARRGWMDKDLELKNWLEFHQQPYFVVATKIDKLKTQKEKYHGLAGIRREAPEAELVPFSAITGEGARVIWQAIQKIRKT